MGGPYEARFCFKHPIHIPFLIVAEYYVTLFVT